MIDVDILEHKHIASIVESFFKLGWNKPLELYERYLVEQDLNERVIWVAFVQGEFAGYVTLNWKSSYLLFQENDIPEIMDLNVLPQFRNNGIATKLLETAENLAFMHKDLVGLGVGLTKDYVNALSLYIKLGYKPDRNGITSNYQCVNYGESTILDDDLVLFFIKDRFNEK